MGILSWLTSEKNPAGPKRDLSEPGPSWAGKADVGPSRASTVRKAGGQPAKAEGGGSRAGTAAQEQRTARKTSKQNGPIRPSQQQQQQQQQATRKKEATESKQQPNMPSVANGMQQKSSARAPAKQQPRQQRQDRSPSRGPATSAGGDRGGPSTTTTAGGGGGMKRVRSSWRMRPLIVDEKLRVFEEGRDEELMHYDGGEFYAWLKDCETGRADPADGFSYPLVVQDSDLRTLLEIKGPEPGAAAAPAAAPAAKKARVGAGGIAVPTSRTLPESEVPDLMLQRADPEELGVVHREKPPGRSPSDVVAVDRSAAAAAAAVWPSAAEQAPGADVPYVRYVQPTPDDLELAIEYDLDEEDEAWLAEYNAQARRAKSRVARRPLSEAWMEHLIDRMEKEYTAELQRHPEKWVLGGGGGRSGGGDDMNEGDAAPPVRLPPIREVFPLERCLQVPGINHYETVIKAVYEYWRGKHQRAGRPLLQRLWYEPPWHRKKAAQRMSKAAGDEGDGPFAAQDSPVALAGIRKRRMEAPEVRSRFEGIRRDLEAARTLADQARRREKLKLREAQLHKEEWAARLQGVVTGRLRVAVQKGRLRSRPQRVYALCTLGSAAASAAQARPSASSDLDAFLGLEPGEVMPTVAEDRAARGAAALNAAAGVRAPPPPRGVTRVAHCTWCGESGGLLLGCASCPRCFCFKCFQSRPGLGVNNWSRAVKDSSYECVVCRGLEDGEEEREAGGASSLQADDASANTLDEVRVGEGAADAADATAPPGRRRAQRMQQQREEEVRQKEAAQSAKARQRQQPKKPPPPLPKQQQRQQKPDKRRLPASQRQQQKQDEETEVEAAAEGGASTQPRTTSGRFSRKLAPGGAADAVGVASRKRPRSAPPVNYAGQDEYEGLSEGDEDLPQAQRRQQPDRRRRPAAAAAAAAAESAEDEAEDDSSDDSSDDSNSREEGAGHKENRSPLRPPRKRARPAAASPWVPCKKAAKQAKQAPRPQPKQRRQEGVPTPPATLVPLLPPGKKMSKELASLLNRSARSSGKRRSTRR